MSSAIVVLVGLAAVWLPLMARWASAWALAPDQAYGWFVPVFAAYFFVERWRRMPQPKAPGGGAAAAAAALTIAGLALVALSLPVLEANVLWPTAQWASAAGAILATLGALAWAGGWKWARHFAFPAFFILTALTWPTPVKSWIVANLEGLNARIAAEIVSAAGWPALVSGNVISVSTGQVGIEEACSGLRSLQAVWMVAWFAGEFFLLNLPRRAFLIGSALAMAFAANLGRTTFLTWVAASRGLTASARWHDWAGNIELIVALSAVALLGWRAHRPRRSRAAEAARPKPASAGRDLWRSPSRSPKASANSGPPPPGIWIRLRGPAIAGLAVGCAAQIGTAGWYRAHERASGSKALHWQLVPSAADWTPVAVPPLEKKVLGSTSAEGLAWDPGGGDPRGWVFVVDWQGSASRGENPEWHDPAICLPATGARLIEQLGTAPVDIGGRELAFSGYRFMAGGRPVTVYFCHWDAELARARTELAAADDDVRARRWQRVFEGRRKGDVSHIAFLLSTDDASVALAWVRRWAPALLRPVS